jgi:ketosteroid isomerase-like protein
MLADTVVADLVRHWDEGWNGGDVDVIMAPFAGDVVFTSPGIPTVTGDASRRSIEGAGALRRYVADALARAGDVRYSVERALAGTDTVVLVYTCHLPDGRSKPGADLLRVDGSGKVVEWCCHHATDPVAWRAEAT